MTVHCVAIVRHPEADRIRAKARINSKLKHKIVGSYRSKLKMVLLMLV